MNGWSGCTSEGSASRASICSLCWVCIQAHMEHHMQSEMKSRMHAASCIPSMQRARQENRQDKYWKKTVVAMIQLSHFVLVRCISSWSIQRVPATLCEKQIHTSRHRQQLGHLDSPHLPLQMQCMIMMTLLFFSLDSRTHTHTPAWQITSTA
jgi:hypothetical protein